MNSENLFGYSVNLIRLSEEDGGGWIADVPELKGCLADGENPGEALDNLKSVIATWLEVAREEGMEIPEPRIYTDSEFSGRFTLRTPKSLHRQLAQEAEMEGVSLNQFILSLISYNLGVRISNKDNDEKQTVSSRYSYPIGANY
ncbi:MAG: toxin-antitoxin system HicB family antitoxin [Syntrophomonadaceae bacterium]|nr:toxin-antitoxin system HicB family antitoxin [Syntrophomonadaceae bacterium]MDD3271168.1 toxin-antitoxin system HicB family antitoxin [Syntrophomonadaceae bacterium]MDD3899252.1 toxin-antitoxin system HicB family antitoxin [Syntrophomonadaceae bacterium]MDD4563224.1 toxin-antitoxin system HicB family antitoxin [Syntrophomonadaceae bacterium]